MKILLTIIGVACVIIGFIAGLGMIFTGLYLLGSAFFSFADLLIHHRITPIGGAKIWASFGITFIIALICGAIAEWALEGNDPRKDSA